MKFFEKLKGILKKKKTEEKVEVKVKTKTELEEFCGEDKEVYEALQNTMFLDPRKIGTTMEEAAKKAEEFEKLGDLTKARLWYDIAGRLAIYEGDPKKVVEFFSQSKRISGEEYPILERVEKAISLAKEYYKKYPKVEEKR